MQSVSLPVTLYKGVIPATVEEILPTVLPVCKPSIFPMFGKEIEMHYVCCLYRLRDREIKAYYNTNIPILPEVPEVVQKIRECVEEITKEEYTYVLINVYRDGTDYLGYHRDKESLDGPIASVSLGATRRFQLKSDATKEVTTYILESGDLVLMHRGCQRAYKHCVPKMGVPDLRDHLSSHNIPLPKSRKLADLHAAAKEANVVPVRVNLTFRY